MRYQKLQQSLTIFVFLAASNVSWARPLPGTKQTIEIISLYDLARNWSRYDRHPVRIEAVYLVDGQDREVYNAGCQNRADPAWVEIPSGAVGQAPPELVDNLNQLLISDHRARVAVGEFYGPQRVIVSPDTPRGVADQPRAINSRCGHLNDWRFQFVFSKMESVEPLPSSEPWARPRDEKKH
jgi:hypothetical protein